MTTSMDSGFKKLSLSFTARTNLGTSCALESSSMNAKYIASSTYHQLTILRKLNKLIHEKHLAQWPTQLGLAVVLAGFCLGVFLVGGRLGDFLL